MTSRPACARLTPREDSEDGAPTSFALHWAASSVREQFKMAEGTIKRLTDKGFGFIDTGSGKDLFFHSSALEGVTFEELREGQRVSFTEGMGPKGPRAESVKVL